MADIAEVAADGIAEQAAGEQPEVEQPEGKQPAKQKVQAAPVQAPRKFKAKIHGKDVELDEQEVIEAGITAAQVRRAASQQFEEAKRLRAEAEALVKRFKDDPEGALAESLGGQDRVDELATQRLIRKLQLEGMDPRDRAVREAQAQAAAAEKKRLEYEEQIKGQEATRLQQHYAQQFNDLFTAALTAKSIPATTETMRRMAGYAKSGAAMGLSIEDSARFAVQHVKQDLAAEQASIFSGLKGPALLDALGPELLKEIRAADLARLKGGGAQPAKPVGTPVPAKPAARNNPQLLSQEEWKKKFWGEDQDPRDTPYRGR
jgi:hypothetical protein